MSEATQKLQEMILGRLAEIEEERRRLEVGIAALGGARRRGRPPGRGRAGRRAS